MTGTTGGPLRLLVRALDAGSTYLLFRWVDKPDEHWVRRLEPPTVAKVTALLDAALIGDSVGAGEQEARRALSGPLCGLSSERDWSAELAELVIGDRVCREITERAAEGPISIEFTPSPALARVPLDLLPVEGDTRVMEKATLVYAPLSALHAGRKKRPDEWAAVADRPVCYVIDPDAPDAAGLSQLLPPVWVGGHTNTSLFANLLERTEHTANSGVRQWISRWLLRDDLLTRPSRLLYFGHVSGTLNQPGSASLHLSDSEYTWGLAAIHGGSHRPLSALDLVYGTVTYPGTADGTVERALRNIPGHELWPMPARVAIIACEGGSDYRSSEVFGLVTACMNAGAELVSTTRWTLPSDGAVSRFASGPDVSEVPGPTTELALAVDAAHRGADPSAELNDWRRNQLHRWRATGEVSARNTPLVWASLTDHVCRWRPPHQRSERGTDE
ncbi:CHAT domain-containing protein [Gordonia bronchialis]|uniref:CHAT domain-containing protein n=1 Tax=Gordonia bronchialis TaxID=2054 RepID=UPI0024325894|nr:CHAT domain-containing protein [Gordonia bronchialis]